MGHKLGYFRLWPECGDGEVRLVVGPNESGNKEHVPEMRCDEHPLAAGALFPLIPGLDESWIQARDSRYKPTRWGEPITPQENGNLYWWKCLVSSNRKTLGNEQKIIILERNGWGQGGGSGLQNQRKYWSCYPRKMRSQKTEIKGARTKEYPLHVAVLAIYEFHFHVISLKTEGRKTIRLA